MFVSLNQENDDLYLDKFKEVMTLEWIDKEIYKMYHNTHYREAGSYLGLLHPIISHHIDIWASIRKAEALEQDFIIMGVGNREIINLGMNLHELDGLYDLDSFRSRLQKKDLFIDTCWELEVAQALRYTGFEVVLNDEKQVRFDITAQDKGTTIAIECKYKHNEDKRYIVNNEFARYLGSMLIEILNKQNLLIDIVITIKEIASIEDSKRIVEELNSLLAKNENLLILNDKYTIQKIDDYRNLSTPDALVTSNSTCCYTGQERLKSEIKNLYREREDGYDFKNRVFFILPEEDNKIKNLKNLIKKANTQIGENKGCLFLHVPFEDFAYCKEEAKNIMKRSAYNNIHLLKIVSLKLTSVGNIGVRIDRKEECIVNSYARNKIPDIELEKLKDNLLFEKYDLNKRP